MRKVYKWWWVGVLIVAIMACDRNRIFEEYQAINQDGWHKDSLLVFDFPISDTLKSNNLYLNIRNDVDYGFSNLWLFVQIEQPDGLAVRDTFEMVLAEPSGRWLGQGMGGLKIRQAMYRNNVFFPRSGTYKVTVQQGMRETILEGIRDVGLRVEKTE